MFFMCITTFYTYKTKSRKIRDLFKVKLYIIRSETKKKERERERKEREKREREKKRERETLNIC